jgi:uncharacterized protein
VHALRPASQRTAEPSETPPGPTRPGLIARITLASLHHPALFLFAAAVVFWSSSILTVRLFGNIRSSFQELLPADMPSVRQIDELSRRVGGDGSVLVLVQSLDGEKGLPQAEGLARSLVDDYLGLGPDVIRSIEWNVRDAEAWYTDHWPLFVSLPKLTEARDALAKAVAEQKRKANPLSLGLDDEDAPREPLQVSAELKPWFDEKEPLPRASVEKGFARYRDGMLVSPDGASVTLNVRPTGTSLGVEEARRLVERMRAVAEKHRAEMDRDHLRVGFGGSFPLFVAEYSSIIGDVRNTLLLTLGLVLASLFLFFRDIRSTLSLGVAVLTAVAVTFALTDIVIGHLNSVTAFLGAIVLGNGINYGIIYLARVRQLRRAGVALEPACVSGAQAAWRATLLASAATSVSFGILVLAANRGFRHFGIIGGMGMLSCWAFTFLLVPALLAVFERLSPVRPALASKPLTVPKWLERFFSHPLSILLAFGALTLVASVLFVRALPVAIERNLKNLTNELRGQDTLLKDHDRASSALGKSISGAIALLDSPEEAEVFCRVVRSRMENPRYHPVIQGCETLEAVLPGQQAAKLDVIHDIARRLSDGVVDSLAAGQRDRARTVRAELRSQAPLTLSQAPATLLDRFRERDGSLGRLAVVTASPDAQLEEAPRLEAFVEGVRNIPVGGRTVDATGENVIFSDLLQNIEREGPMTTLLSLLGVCLLVGLFLRNARTSAAVIASLISGVVLMGGVATLMGLRINFLNFIVYPITFGIAVDYGANVVLRAQERRGRVLQALVEVGPAVVVCSWTTIIGYGSLVIASNRALRSFGWYALLGEVACLCTALVALPALLLRFAPQALQKTKGRLPEAG